MATPATELLDEVYAALSNTDDLASFTQAVTYNSFASGGGTTTIAVPNAVLYNFDEREIDGETVRRTDRRILFSSKDLGLSPKSTDYFTIGGNRWEIVGWEDVPGDAIWLFHIRKPGDGR